jgi:hypothetical protein
MNRISHFMMPLKIRCTSTADLRNFCPSCLQYSWNYITARQINTTTYSTADITLLSVRSTQLPTVQPISHYCLSGQHSYVQYCRYHITVFQVNTITYITADITLLSVRSTHLPTLQPISHYCLTGQHTYLQYSPYHITVCWVNTTTTYNTADITLMSVG